jgi:hypothetical protein
MDEAVAGKQFLANANWNRWLVSENEYSRLSTENYGMVKLGWKAKKVNCCYAREDLHVQLSYSILLIVAGTLLVLCFRTLGF